MQDEDNMHVAYLYGCRVGVESFIDSVKKAAKKLDIDPENIPFEVMEEIANESVRKLELEISNSPVGESFLQSIPQ